MEVEKSGVSCGIIATQTGQHWSLHVSLVKYEPPLQFRLVHFDPSPEIVYILLDTLNYRYKAYTPSRAGKININFLKGKIIRVIVRGMAPGAALSGAAKQAENLKEDGNRAFGKNRFRAAIDAYTEVKKPKEKALLIRNKKRKLYPVFVELDMLSWFSMVLTLSGYVVVNAKAITLCPDVPVYWTNRALCQRKRNNWFKVEEDCRKAIQLDHNSVKGHYMLGLALLQRQEYTEGIKELSKALELGRGANRNGYMVEEIWQELANAKYMEWEHASRQRSWELESLREVCEKAAREKHFSDDSEPEEFLDDDSVASYLNQIEDLRAVFTKAAEDDTPTEVPDYQCCKITFDIFRDPVITPCGISYERAVILDHLEKVGQFDPVTREPLSPSQLVPNLAIKGAVQAFLDKHGWAYRTEESP